MIRRELWGRKMEYVRGEVPELSLTLRTALSLNCLPVPKEREAMVG